MQRILIIGGNGSGKTTLARELAQKLQLPLVHLDVLYWRDNWQSAPHSEFQALLRAELQKPRWIIDGNIASTLPLRLTYCDTVIFLDFSRLRCLCGAVWRVIQNYGKSRPDMGGNCPERFDQSHLTFFKTVWNFNKNNRARYYKMIDNVPEVRCIVLKSRRQVKAFLRQA